MAKKKCFVCENGMEELALHEAECMVKYGWYAHFVDDDSDFPYHVNCHTHGLEKKYGHPDFQICFPLPVEIAHSILSNLANAVKAGDLFLANDKRYSNILGNNFDIKLIEATECGRTVLRVILPDKFNVLDKDQIDKKYSDQYGGK